MTRIMLAEQIRRHADRDQPLVELPSSSASNNIRRDDKHEKGDDTQPNGVHDGTASLTAEMLVFTHDRLECLRTLRV